MQRHICVQSLNSQCLVWSEVKWSSPSHVQLFLTPWTYTAHGILQARIPECSSDLILQGIIPTQESNPGLPHCRQILYPLIHKGSPKTLECVAYPFSRGFSWPRNQTRVSCIAGGFFANWAIREAKMTSVNNKYDQREVKQHRGSKMPTSSWCLSQRHWGSLRCEPCS